MKENSGAALWERAKRIIPGAGQLLSKRSEQFLPGRWPSYYRNARGVEVWDLDGNRYTHMSSMGPSARPLGYADPAVNALLKASVEPE